MIEGMRQHHDVSRWPEPKLAQAATMDPTYQRVLKNLRLV